MITLFLFIILIHCDLLYIIDASWLRNSRYCIILTMKSKKYFKSKISRWDDWNRKENDKDSFLQFFFIFTFNENLNLQIGVTYMYKISSKSIDNQKSAIFYQKRLKKKETINFKKWSNTFYQRNFIIYYKIFIDKVSYNDGNISNRESKKWNFIWS